MQISDVRIKLVEGGAERLLAFCSITIDEAFVVRDMKIIGSPDGPFVAMPSRKLCSHCPACGFKNQLRAGFCNHCGGRLPAVQPRGEGGRVRLYADIAHPINAACRDSIERRVVEEYRAELKRARQPGYVSRYDPLGDEEQR